MRQLYSASLVALAVLIPSTFLGQEKVLNTTTAPRLKLRPYTVGKNLEVAANLGIEGAPSREDVTITLTSNDPKRLLLAKMPDAAGSPSITVTARGGWQSPEFYLQALADQGTATFTASAPGFASADATVTLGFSGFVLALRARVGVPSFQTTTGALPTEIGVVAALLDQDHKFVVPQSIAGGTTAKLNLVSSNTSVGTVADTSITIPGGYNRVMTTFHPHAEGTTTLAAKAPADYSTVGDIGSMVVNVRVPGIGITDQLRVGKNLQIGGIVSLGQVAPPGGVTVTLTSHNPNLLISPKADKVGSSTLKLEVPAGRLNSNYYLQALDGSGAASYSATAPGYADRTATLELTPSGIVVIGPLTFPEGQLLNKDGPREHGFITPLAGKPTTLEICTVQLDPVSLRGADITVQALRGGMDVTVQVQNSDATVGEIDSSVVIHGGTTSSGVRFNPTGLGTTMISAVPPAGFTKAANDTSLKIVVKQ